MKVGFLKRLVSFYNQHAARIEIIAATAITLTFIGTFYYQGRRVSRAREKASDSYEARNQVQQVYTNVKEMETAFRDYILTGGNTDFISPYEDSTHIKSSPETGEWTLKEGLLFEQMRQLKELVSRDPVQLERANRLGDLIGQKWDHFQDGVHIYKEKGDEAAEKEIVSAKGRELTEQIHAVILALLSTEYEKFNKQESIKRKYWQQNRILLRGGVVALYFCLLLLVRVSDMRNRRRYQLESNLKEYDVMLNAVMDGGKHAIIIGDKNQIIKSFNRASERLYGYEASHFIGNSMQFFGTETLLNSEVEEAAKALSEELERPATRFEVFNHPLEKQGSFEKEWTIVRKDGAKIPIVLSITAMRDSNG